MPKPSDDKVQVSWPQKFAVSVEYDQVVRFVESVTRQKTQLTKKELAVPMTFAASWLGLPEVETTLLEQLGISFEDKKKILFHLEQGIELIGELVIGKCYSLVIEDSTLTSDNRFVVHAEVRDLRDELQVRLRSTFVVLDTGQMSS